MGAAEGQKRSYVEMILSSEVEVKLRCDKEWKMEMQDLTTGMVQGRWKGKGRPRATQDRPKSRQDHP